MDDNHHPQAIDELVEYLLSFSSAVIHELPNGFTQLTTSS